MQKRNDIFLIILVLVIAIVGFFALKIYQKEDEFSNAQVIITIDKKVYKSYNLNENIEEKIETEYGYNTLVIKDNKAYISEADCPDGICVSHKEAAKQGETIVCLPHRLVVEIKGGENSEFDAVVN